MKKSRKVLPIKSGVPETLCKENDYPYIIYSDTDSVYFHAQPLLEKLFKNFEEMDEGEKDMRLEQVAIKYQDLITSYYDVFSKNTFNVSDHKLEMKTEAVIRSSYFRATRRYAQWITKKEGIKVEELDIKGLEFMKVNFPKIFGDMFHKVVEDVLKGADAKMILKDLRSFKNNVINLNLPLQDIGNPTAVKTLEKYNPKVKDNPFPEFKKRTPGSVRAAIRYNNLLDVYNLSGKYSYITQYDKIKWVYLKDNQYKINSMAFLDYDIPMEIKNFLIDYIDIDKTFDKILQNKLEGLFEDLGWSFDLNPYINKFETLDV